MSAEEVEELFQVPMRFQILTFEDFTFRLDELRDTIREGVGYFTVWEGLMVQEKRSVQALNHYKGLFVPAVAALVWMAINELAKVFDRNPKTVSLRNLLNAAKMDPKKFTPFLTVEDLEQIQRRVDSNEPLLKRLKRVRDQRLAHYDAMTSGDMKLTYGELKQLVEEVKSMYNCLRHGHDQHYTMFDSLAADSKRHTSEVVGIICDARDRANRRNRRTE